jgi:N-acetylneuraminate synthase
MQCNTNYTGSLENFKYIQLNVLRAYREMFPNLILGLSDHTPGHSTVLGAIALGARVVEKHFTLDKAKEGPDHAFSMSPSDWHEMVCRSRELENALGNGIKKIEDNELETVLIQRRSIRTTRAIKSGETLSLSDLTFLRPCPEDGIPPYMAGKVIEKKLTRDIAAGEHITLRDLKS